MTPWLSILILVGAFIVLLKAADFAVGYASRLAGLLRVSAFVVSFIVVGLVSASPESVIALLSHLRGEGNAAVMTLIASNVADLTLVIGVSAFLMRGVKVDATVLQRDALYLSLLFLPFLFAFDGVLSRLEGAVLLLGGLLFFGLFAVQSGLLKLRWPKGKSSSVLGVTALLIVSLGFLLWSANLVVGNAESLGKTFGVPSYFLSILVVGIGVCLPELLFAIKSLRSKKAAGHGGGGMALGNIFSVCIIDGTIVLGLLALIHPIAFSVPLMLVTTLFMGLALMFVITFLRSGSVLGWQEGVVLVVVYGSYIAVTLLRIH